MGVSAPQNQRKADLCTCKFNFEVPSINGDTIFLDGIFLGIHVFYESLNIFPEKKEKKWMGDNQTEP